MLEVIDKGTVTDEHPTPLLFVHGGYHAAWCWDEHLLDFFATKGYRAVALSLRGHGGSTTVEPINSWSITDYVDDVCAIADTLLPAEPVVIGHSMGGFIVQKYLERRTAPAAVLLASAPPSGVTGAQLRLMRKHPLLVARAMVTKKSLHCFGTPTLAREAYFSPSTPDVDVARFSARLQEESTRAIQGMMRNLPKPESIPTPTLVLGAACDGSISAAEVRSTARAYRTEAEVFPDMGHDMMLEPGWAAVAERIDDWLKDFS